MSNLKTIQKYFGKIKRDLKEQFPDSEIHLEVEDNNGTYNVSLTALKPGTTIEDNPLPEDTYLTMYREISPGKWIDLELFVIDEKSQGKGIAKMVHKHQFELAKKLKIAKMDMYANCEVGGYAWVKTGFVPTKPAAFQRSLMSNWVKGGSGEKLKPLLDELTTVSPEKCIELVRANPGRYKDLLLGTGWDGRLDLTDRAAVKWYENWIGVDAPITYGTSPGLVKDSVRNQVRLEQYKAKLLKDIDKPLRAIDRNIRQKLSGLDVEFIRDLSKSDLSELLRELRETNREIYDEFTSDLEDELQGLSDTAVNLEAATLNNAMVFNTAVSVERGVAWQAALDNPISATGDLLESFIQDATAYEIKFLEKRIKKGMVNGLTVDQMIRDIRGSKNRKFKDGALSQSLNRLRTMVRTSVQHVNSEARFETWKANEDIIKGYQWVSTLDGSTSTTCRSLDNQVFEFEKGPKPPIHPNCRSTTVPYFADDVALWDEDATRSSEFGYVPQGTTYYSWLKGQDKQFVTEVLGPTRAKLFDKMTAEEFTELSMDKAFQPRTLEQMKAENPTVFKTANV